MSSQENWRRGVSLLPNGPNSALIDTGDRYQRGAKTKKPALATMYEVAPLAYQAKRHKADAAIISPMLKSEAATGLDCFDGALMLLRLTLELSGGAVVRLERDVRCRHDCCCPL
jgi:hypothetical protein